MPLLLKRVGFAVATIAVLAYVIAPFFGAPWRASRGEFAVISLIYISISSWIIGVEMRAKIKKDLGRKATDLDLTSIDTWMKVDEVEHPDDRDQS